MKKALALSVFLVSWSTVFAQQDLLSNFRQPTQEAKPRVWWHWMNGNITQDGIRKDLDWMEKTGIGGFQNFDANLFTPVVVPQKLVFMTPEWKAAFKLATDLAGQKGLEMAIAGSPGWSVTGGPWVNPEDAMKKYVWSELTIEGGKSFQGKLPRPSDVTGKFQDAHLEEGGFSGSFVGEKPHFYRDALVIAFPTDEKKLIDFSPKLSSSGGNFSLEILTDGSLAQASFLPPMEIGEDMWIQYSFDQPQTFQAFSISGAMNGALAEFDGGPKNRRLKVSNDGVNFTTVATVSGSIVPLNTVSIPPTTAKYWRITYETLPPQPNIFAAMAGLPPQEKPDGVQVAEFQLYTDARIDQVEDKAGFTPWTEDYSLSKIRDSEGLLGIIPSGKVIDLTSKLQADGSLTWEVPAGQWKIVRLGYSLTGRQNHPASPEATGLEVDKLDAESVRRYINHYLDLYQDATGGKLGSGGLEYMILDSYEAGHMTWTQELPREFQQRRGYSLIPYLPTLTGRVVNSVEESEKFLWDFRKTIGELISDNHYDVIGEELKKRGMKRYTESHENKRIYLADGLDVKRLADIPMAAMWTPGSLAGGSDEEVRSEADIRESASVANIYGKPFVAAESMTSVGRPFQEYPERLKRTADLELASGLNRFVIHTSVHQPLDDKKPGFSLGPFGQYFSRQETWSDMAKPWIDYLARSSSMLQQGRNVADILYLYGENTNITWVARDKLPDLPKGYEFDFVNSTALLEAIEADHGKLKAISGATYEVLVLDSSTELMNLKVLQKLKVLAEAGVKIIGKRPIKSPSLGDSDAEFQALADLIWSKSTVKTSLEMPVEEDVIISGTHHKILFRHRSTGTEEIFWLNNRSADPTSAGVSFRTTDKKPMRWNPIDGSVHEVSYEIKNGRTLIPLSFDSWDAFFIVFQEPTDQLVQQLPEVKETVALTMDGTWTLDFAGEKVEFPTLTSWSDHLNPKIKYYSGTVTYSHTFTYSPAQNERYVLDLGTVKNLAEIIVNGRNLGVLWKAPFRMDISEALKSGENKLEIKVVNLWVNRLIGDSQPGVEKTTFTTMPFYQPNSPLVPSGLLGPVVLIKQD